MANGDPYWAAMQAWRPQGKMCSLGFPLVLHYLLSSWSSLTYQIACSGYNIFLCPALYDQPHIFDVVYLFLFRYIYTLSRLICKSLQENEVLTNVTKVNVRHHEIELHQNQSQCLYYNCVNLQQSYNLSFCNGCGGCIDQSL